MCENSRSISSSLSHDEEISSSIEPRSRYARSRTNSTSTRSTPNETRKSSKGSDDIVELAKTVQDGMADLAIYDDELDSNNPEEIQKKLELMKTDLIKKIKNDEPVSRKSSALRRKSTEESIEEEIMEIERPISRGRKNSTVSFYGNSEDNSVVSTSTTENGTKLQRESSNVDKRLSGKPIEKYCIDIIQDIEKSNKVIEKHVQQYNHSIFENDKLVEQLQVVDKINEFVSTNGEIPKSALTELNNNFKMLTDQMFSDVPSRKRSISGKRGSRETKPNLLVDTNMTNQDMLDDLLGKK